MCRRFALVLFILIAVPGAMYAWGCSGHHIVVLIALRHLNVRALAGAEGLLAAEAIDPNLARYCKDQAADPLVGAATWADDVKRAEGTGTWHYIDIPRGISRGDPNQYCEPVGPLQNGNRRGCLLSAIHDQLAILGNGSQPERARALRYVIHLIGDMHQPLHVNDNADRGGNCVVVHSGSKTTNLHSLWDSGILDGALLERHLTEQDFARELDGGYQRHFEDWASSKQTLEQWVWDIHKIGVRVTYGKLRPLVPLEAFRPVDDCTVESAKTRALNIVIGPDYQRSAMEAIEPLLAMAGYRLAGLLNRVWP